MEPALIIANSIGVSHRARSQKSGVHRLSLALVWLTVASSSLVAIEPAPVDALTFGLFVLLPVVGLTQSNKALAAGFAIWLTIAGFGMLSAALSRGPSLSFSHTAVSLYLACAGFLFAVFVAKNPERHTRLILSAYLTASVTAALLGIVGYLELFPGAYELLTRYDRAISTFKDPNVFGPYLICGLLTAIYLWLVRTPARGIPALAAATLIATAILFSFSRGAWAASLIAVALYSYLFMLTARKNADRLKLALAALLGTALVGLILAAALQSDGVGRLLQDRAALSQTYDEGTEGRFGGQRKAVDLILENPLGIGAGVFTEFHHHEDVHNVYLSMLLNTGWIGGLAYFIIFAATLALGFEHALRPTRTQPLFLIVYAALAANTLEGVLIDSDHWRHIYLLMGVAWGLMSADRRAMRSSRAVRDVRPILLRRELILPPQRRGPRILRRAIATIPTALPRHGLAPPRRRRRRPGRIERRAADA